MNGEDPRASGRASYPLVEPSVLQGLIDAVADIVIVLDAKGRIESTAVSPLSGDLDFVNRWVGQNINAFLTGEAAEKLEKRMSAPFPDLSGRKIELTHSGHGFADFPVRYALYPLERTDELMLIGRDLRELAASQQRLLDTQVALEQDYERFRSIDLRFRMFMHHTSDALLYVSLPERTVVAASAPAAAILGKSLKKIETQQLSKVLPTSLLSQIDLDALLRSGASTIRTVAAPQTDLVADFLPMRAGGEKGCFIRLQSDGDPEAVAPGITSLLRAFYDQTRTAHLIADGAGRVISTNEAFRELTGAGDASRLERRAVDEILGRGTVDAKILIKNAQDRGYVRRYATDLCDEAGLKIPVVAAVATVEGPEGQFLVFSFEAIVGANTKARPAADASGALNDEDDLQNAIELVGSASLREIVTETTDVIEKLCIRAALERTNNNRVAAAELLGLSRQSLYVKLRRYDML